MINSRINYFSRYLPDDYGNSNGTIIPKKQLQKKVDTSAIDEGINNLRAQAEEAKNSYVNTNTNKSGSVIDDPSKLTGDIIKGGETFSNLKSSGLGAKGSGLAAAGTVVGSIAGQQLDKKGKEVTGGILKGTTQGFTTGLTTTGNPLIAAGAGIVGGVIGGIAGKKKQNNRIKKEKEIEDQNARMKKLQKKSLQKAEDLNAYKNLLSSYRQGGTFVQEVITEDKPSLSSAPIFKFDHNPNVTKEDLKPLEKNSPKVPMFRRGGPIDIKKKNVIVDGPSHEEENNTGVKGDRGLPVVLSGKKVAEIESLELVMNHVSANKLKGLVDKYESTGDIKIKEEIGKILEDEFKYNTYDYSNLMD